MKKDEKITAYISLGGNMGAEAERFAEALGRIDSWPGVRVLARSSLYRTEPQGDPAQPWFVNQVAALCCAPDVTPDGLLAQLLRLETAFGRMRDKARRFGPRTLDIDLLLFGDTAHSEKGVEIPHPRMTQRAFVLVPLCEIAPGLRLPDGSAVSELLGQLPYTITGDAIYQS